MPVGVMVESLIASRSTQDAGGNKGFSDGGQKDMMTKPERQLASNSMPASIDIISGGGTNTPLTGDREKHGCGVNDTSVSQVSHMFHIGFNDNNVGLKKHKKFRFVNKTGSKVQYPMDVDFATSLKRKQE